MANVVKDLSTNVLQIVVFALVIGTILGASAFTSITLVNITALSAQYGLAITAFVGFFALIGTVGALVWLFKYIKPLFDRNTGINSVVA
jgi:Na+/H+-dicarboxylate symporter